MTTRVAPAVKHAAQGLAPSPGPYLCHQTLYLPRTQKTAEPAPASQKKGKETAPARAYWWAGLTSRPGDRWHWSSCSDMCPLSQSNPGCPPTVCCHKFWVPQRHSHFSCQSPQSPGPAHFPMSPLSTRIHHTLLGLLLSAFNPTSSRKLPASHSPRLHSRRPGVSIWWPKGQV